jgi:hypothetical protein
MGGGGFAAYRFWELSFVRKATRLRLPMWPAELYTFDNAEFCELTYMTLKPTQVQDVLNSAAFHPALHHPERVSPQDPSDFMLITQLPVEKRRAVSNAALYHAGGCSDHQSWSALLDPGSGSLWIEVLYPDMGGDDPSCSFPTSESFGSAAASTRARWRSPSSDSGP